MRSFYVLRVTVVAVAVSRVVDLTFYFYFSSSSCVALSSASKPVKLLGEFLFSLLSSYLLFTSVSWTVCIDEKTFLY